MERNLSEKLLNDLVERFDDSRIREVISVRGMVRMYAKEVKNQYPYLRRSAIAIIAKKLVYNKINVY